MKSFGERCQCGINTMSSRFRDVRHTFGTRWWMIDRCTRSILDVLMIFSYGIHSFAPHVYVWLRLNALELLQSCTKPLIDVTRSQWQWKSSHKSAWFDDKYQNIKKMSFHYDQIIKVCHFITNNIHTSSVPHCFTVLPSLIARFMGPALCYAGLCNNRPKCTPNVINLKFDQVSI